MKPAIYKSLGLHVAVVLLIMLDLPLFWRRDMTLNQVPIIVDLDQVKIDEFTNLPSKAQFGAEDKKATKVKEEKPAPKPEPKPEPKSEPEEKVETKTPPLEPVKEEEAPQPPKKDFIVPPPPEKPVKDKKPEPKPKNAPPPPPSKPKPKVAPKKAAPAKTDVKTKQPDNMLKNLMDSVDNLERNLAEEVADAVIKEGTKVQNMGIEGGSGGSYFSELTISETDAIASRLRACWNLDPGARGIEDMVVEIRAHLSQDGTVQRVDVVDSGRYSRDVHFRSVADSAKRAVYVCAPYSILSEKYGNKYDMWKTMLLRFNPISHTVN